IARQRQVLTQELSILRDDRVCRDPVLVAQYTALGMSKTGLLAVEHHGAVGRDCRTSPVFAAGFGAKHSKRVDQCQIHSGGTLVKHRECTPALWRMPALGQRSPLAFTLPDL